VPLVRLGKWTFMASAAALGAAALAWGQGGRVAATTNPYEQVIGSAVIDTVAGGKPFDIRGEALQREAGKFTVTLVRTADSATGALKVGVFSSAQMNITIKLSSGSSYSIKGVHAISDSVGMLGGVNGAALEQVVFSR
jgi:hypothetical protein